MVGVTNDRTSKVKRKDELIDLETLFTQRQDRLFQALEERYQYNAEIPERYGPVDNFYHYIVSC